MREHVCPAGIRLFCRRMERRIPAVHVFEQRLPGSFVQVDDVEIIWDVDPAAKDAAGLFSVAFPAQGRGRAILGMPENNIAHMMFSGQQGGFLDGSVSYEMRSEDIRIGVRAEGFMKKPVGAFQIMAADRLTRFVAGAYDALTVLTFHMKAVLFGLAGMRIEECDGVSGNGTLLSVFDGNEADAGSYRSKLLFAQRELADGPKFFRQARMTVYAQNVVALFLQKERRDHAHQPDDAERVIDVLMGDEDVRQIEKGYARLVQLNENAVAAPAVHQQTSFRTLKHEAGVVVMQRIGRSRTENDEPVHKAPPHLALISHHKDRRTQRQGGGTTHHAYRQAAEQWIDGRHRNMRPPL